MANLTDNIKKVGKALEDSVGRKFLAVRKALVIGAAVIMRDSLIEVPRDYGNLAASGFTYRDEDEDHIKIIVGYRTKYAIYVHERMDLAHGQAWNLKHTSDLADARARGVTRGPYRHDRGPKQKAKFLEDPFKTWAPRIIAACRAAGAIK